MDMANAPFAKQILMNAAVVSNAKQRKQMTNKLRLLGPGILFAGAAIGVSHLVQSTRAGAGYGFSLLWVLFFANAVKYPFYEVAPRYTASTGESLLAGYKRQGTWAIWLYLAVTVLSMFTIVGAVTMVTASISAQIFALNFSLVHISIVIISICMIILILGDYSLLDKTIKAIVLILSISTVCAVCYAAATKPMPSRVAESIWTNNGILFLVAFIGWMPATLDIAVWQSVWITEQKKKKAVTLKSALFDFNLGYLGAAFLSIFFLALGAILMFPTGQEFSSKGTVFSSQLIQLYTESIGSWSRPIIEAAALTAMFSTTLTCLDGFPRTLAHLKTLYSPEQTDKEKKQSYWLIISVLAIGSVLLISVFIASLTAMVDFATTLSCLITPVLAWLNYRVITSDPVPLAAQPSKLRRQITILCLALLLALPILYLYSRFI